jgi:secreted trypsin-like serine protease
VGGEESREREFPWLVKVGGCGGTLIAPNIVMCAAHCGTSMTQVQIGLHNKNANDACVETIAVTKVVVHAQYDDVSVSNDNSLH